MKVEKSLQRIHRGQKNAMYTTQKSIDNKAGTVNGWKDLLMAVGFRYLLALHLPFENDDENESNFFLSIDSNRQQMEFHPVYSFHKPIQMNDFHSVRHHYKRY